MKQLLNGLAVLTGLSPAQLRATPGKGRLQQHRPHTNPSHRSESGVKTFLWGKLFKTYLESRTRGTYNSVLGNSVIGRLSTKVIQSLEFGQQENCKLLKNKHNIRVTKVHKLWIRNLSTKDKGRRNSTRQQGFSSSMLEGLSATSPEMKRQIKALEGQYPGLAGRKFR